VNQYLEWAFIEAGNLVVVHQKHLPGEHVIRLYQRVKRKRNLPEGGGNRGPALD
jgi:hypothetical protein